ncbi:hypothetical protein O1M54_30625 [Streptomyces diastatochromogenes]|nr:hypothetical protein [Streptomyces diastatochromogenes]
MDACTLGDLLDVVGGPALHLHTAPAGQGVPVTEAVLYDGRTPLPGCPARCCWRSGCGRRRRDPWCGRRRRLG